MVIESVYVELQIYHSIELHFEARQRKFQSHFEEISALSLSILCWKSYLLLFFFGAVCGYLITCSRNWRLYIKNYTRNWTLCTDNNRKIHMKQLNYLTIVTNNLKLTELFQIPTRRKRRSLFIIYFSIVIFLEF